MLLARCSPSEAPLCGLAVVAAMLFRSLDPIRISLLVDTVCVCVCICAVVGRERTCSIPPPPPPPPPEDRRAKSVP